jgi:hypothetical protein
MQIAQAEGKDWRDKILDYVMGYRAKMHPTTGQSPAKLLFQREIRTKMPELRGYQATDDQAVRDFDAERKGLSKLYTDKKRGAVQGDIEPGDTVLLKREQRQKLDTPFLPTPCKVIDKAGTKITVQTPGGATYARNSSLMKKYINSDVEIQAQENPKTPPQPQFQTDTAQQPSATQLPNPTPHSKKIRTSENQTEEV